jgi:hypothetical protein
MLRRIFGPKNDEIIAVWETLNNKELHNVYSPRIIGMIRSRRMRWAEHIACMGENRNAYRDSVGRREGTRPLGVDVRITSKLGLKEL